MADDSEIRDAYTSGMDLADMKARFGRSEDEIRHLVGAPPARRPSPLATASRLTLVIGGAVPLVLGLAWLIIYYVSEQRLPVESWGYGNLAVGFSALGLAALCALVSAIFYVFAQALR